MDITEKVIGIGIDAPKFTKTNSEDFILMDCSHWTDEDREYYERANEGLGFFKTGNLLEKNVTEFPILKD
jgi:hypothetical protein